MSQTAQLSENKGKDNLLPDPTLLIVGALAVFFAGVSKGGFGSGAAFAAGPILSLVMDPRFAVGLLLPLLMLIDLVGMKSFWGKWHTPSALTMCIGAIPGVTLGAFFFQITNADGLRLLMGVLAIAFVAYQWPRDKGWWSIPNRSFRATWGLITGIASGFTSFVGHAGGPPAAVFLLAQGMSKTTYHATSVVTFWVINVLKAVPYGVLGLFTAETLVLDIWLAPVAVIGAFVGIKAHYLVSERLFFGLTYVLLICTGCKLIWDALT